MLFQKADIQITQSYFLNHEFICILTHSSDILFLFNQDALWKTIKMALSFIPFDIIWCPEFGGITSKSFLYCADFSCNNFWGEGF